MSDRVNDRSTLAARRLRANARPSYLPEKPKSSLPGVFQLATVAACSAGVTLAAFGGMSLFPRHPGGVPVIEAPPGPVRVKPADAGGMKLTGTDMVVGGPGTQALGPAAEQPAIDALRAQLRAVQKLAQHASLEADTARLAIAARIMASPAPAQASAKVREPAPAPAAAPPTAEARPVPPPEPGIRVQLAAFADSAAAYSEWDAMVTKWPDLLARRRPDISRVQSAGRTMWRLRTGTFANVGDATAFCATLHDRGADCSVATF
jgi:hypothetical protein